MSNTSDQQSAENNKKIAKKNGDQNKDKSDINPAVEYSEPNEQDIKGEDNSEIGSVDEASTEAEKSETFQTFEKNNSESISGDVVNQQLAQSSDNINQAIGASSPSSNSHENNTISKTSSVTSRLTEAGTETDSFSSLSSGNSDISSRPLRSAADLSRSTGGSGFDAEERIVDKPVYSTQTDQQVIIIEEEPVYDYSGDDIFKGTNGNNTFIGRDGNDTFLASAGDDLFDGGAGIDVIDYSAASTSIAADLQSGVVSSADFGTDIVRNVEHVIGGSSDDILTGSSSDNILSGGSGHDTINGGDGNDTLFGGDGSDSFIFEAASAYSATDTIGDFDTAEGDILDLSDLLSGFDPVQDAITDFIQITDNGTHSSVAVDSSGNGTNYQAVATLNNVTGLTDEAQLYSDGTIVV